MQQRFDPGTARYEQIAMDVAQKIVRGEFQPGQKLSGRSLLAGTYGVSPETIRRSIALLQNIGVVEAKTGSGVIVKSAEMAGEYLKEYNERQDILDLRGEINKLLEQRRKLDSLLEKELFKLLEYSFRRSSILQEIEEVIISCGSWLAGKTIAETNIRSRTGATIVAIVRDGKEIFSPAIDEVLSEGDKLIIVGTSAAKEMVRGLIIKD